MFLRKALFIGVTIAMAGTLPALAQQSRGGAQQRTSTPTSPMQRGSMTQDRLQDRDRLQTQDRDQIYGSQLMTPAERNSYRKQMRKLKTNQEREALRQQHHEQMQKRATERGVTLPATPPGQGAGMQQRTLEQNRQQQQNQSAEQQIQQKQRTEQKTQPSKDSNGN